MAPRPPLRIHLSLFVAAIILLACSATGMLAGAFAHTLASKQSPGSSVSGPVISGTPPGGASATATPSLVTETPTVSGSATGFTLSITLSARSVSPGETFTVTVIATANGAPLSGLSCALRAPTDGPPGLLSTWPAPVVTDANGEATWTVTTPSVTPGTYGIEADAIGSHRYEFHRYASLTVK